MQIPPWLRRYATLGALLMLPAVLPACGQEPNEERIAELEEKAAELEQRIEVLENEARPR